MESSAEEKKRAVEKRADELQKAADIEALAQEEVVKRGVMRKKQAEDDKANRIVHLESVKKVTQEELDLLKGSKSVSAKCKHLSFTLR